MSSRLRVSQRNFVTHVAVMMLSFLPLVSGQDHDRDRDRDGDRDRDRVTRLEPGTVIPVRTNETVDVERRDNRVYSGMVDQDVRGTNGALAIPRGSTVELIVRVAPDNDLILDLDAVMVNAQRYAIKTDPNRIESRRDDSIVGAIVGAINGGQARGQAVRVPRDSMVTFRLERPMELGVADRGSTRDGHHYHDDDGDHDRDRDRER
jgi:hypothetical protein